MLSEPLAAVIEFVAGATGGRGIEAGIVATGLLAVWRGHRILTALQSALRTVRVGFVSAALVGLLILVGLRMGWVSMPAIPFVSG